MDFYQDCLLVLDKIKEKTENKLILIEDKDLGWFIDELRDKINALKRLTSNSYTKQLEKSNCDLRDQLIKQIGISKARKLKLDEMQNGHKVKSSNLARLSLENNYMRERIKKLYGHEGYINVMAATDCPGGFDIYEYKKKNNLK